MVLTPEQAAESLSLKDKKDFDKVLVFLEKELKERYGSQNVFLTRIEKDISLKVLEKIKNDFESKGWCLKYFKSAYKNGRLLDEYETIICLFPSSIFSEEEIKIKVEKIKKASGIYPPGLVYINGVLVPNMPRKRTLAQIFEEFILELADR